MTVTIQKISGDGKSKLQSILDNAKKISVDVGWVERKQYPDSNMTTASAAAINEFGSPSHNIPARPFIRPTVKQKQNEWKRIINDQSKKIINGKQSIENTMEIIGSKSAGDIRETITNIWSPSLKISTVKARLARRNNKNHVGNLTKPLIDTAYMLNSLTHKVINEK